MRPSGSPDYPQRAQGRFRLAQEARIRSGLEQQREREALSSIDGERVRRFGQASFDGGTVFKSTWKPGFLYLTENRVLFFQGANGLVDIPVIELERITIVQRDWVPGRRIVQLCLIQQNERGKRVFYMRVANPEGWKDALEKVLNKEVVHRGRSLPPFAKDSPNVIPACI